MMGNFEENLTSLGRPQVTPPDSDEFLHRLHARIGRWKGRRQGIIAATSVGAAIVVFGLFQLANDRGSESDVELLSEIYGYVEYGDSLYADDAFYWEAMDYLVRVRVLTGDTWEVLEELEQLGIFTSSNTVAKETSS